MTFRQENFFLSSPPTCERCSGHGYLKTSLGRLACLECSAATNSSWIPASQPPVCESVHAGASIQCLGVVVTPDSRFHDLMAYWPARDRWTATRFDGFEPADVEIDVSHWMPSPGLPMDAS